MQRLLEFDNKIEELDATSDNIKSLLCITTDTDLTPANDAKDKYILLSVSNVSDLHHILQTKQTVLGRHGHTVTLSGDNEEWMNEILIYILGLIL